MKPDFLYHLLVSIMLMLLFTSLVGWKKAVALVIALQVGKEIFDFFIDPTNIDPSDWLGDFLGVIIPLIFLKMKNKLGVAALALLFNISLFAQGGFPAVNPTPLPNGTIVIVQPPNQNSTAVPLDSLLGIGRVQGNKGSNIASSGSITLGSGNFFHITGSSTINEIAETGWRLGSVVILHFEAALTLAHNATSTGATPLYLIGEANLSVAANTPISFVYDGTYWRQIN